MTVPKSNLLPLRRHQHSKVAPLTPCEIAAMRRMLGGCRCPVIREAVERESLVYFRGQPVVWDEPVEREARAATVDVNDHALHCALYAGEAKAPSSLLAVLERDLRRARTESDAFMREYYKKSLCGGQPAGLEKLKPLKKAAKRKRAKA
ncbi:MAG: hypothetical protein IMZ71_01985 [Chloroflexi bacterium]|nr:hypothetical protein [Chloroflexota bacterium]